MKNLIILSSFLFLVFQACRNEDEMNNLRKQLSLSEFKLALAHAKEETNLVTELIPNADETNIRLEDGSFLLLQSSLIKSIQYDSTNWLVYFYFHDGSFQTVNFIGSLNISVNEIIPDPFLTCPLTALASLKTPVKGKFTIRIKGKNEQGVTIEKSFENYSNYHELPVLGLYENHDNEIQFIFMNKNGEFRCSQSIFLHTPSIANKPDLGITVKNNQLSTGYNGLFMVFSQKIGFDQVGEIRWYYNGNGTTFFHKLRNGNFISSSSDNLSFYEVTMLGQTVKKFNVPNALHHEIIEMPSGNFLVAAHSPPGPPFEDVVIEIDRNNGNVMKTWDFNFILDPSRKGLPDTQTGDWLHINAMYFDEADNSFVVSARSQSAVIKMDYATGTVKWILGNHNFWTETFQQYLLTPIDANGNQLNISITDFWNYGQHAIQKTKAGNVLMYDNGDYREFYDDPNVPQNSYTRLAEYKINEQLKTVRLIWQFDNGKSIFTKYTGYVQDLPGTNTRLAAYMWVTGNTPLILELDANNNILFEATLKQSTAIYYRTYKVDVYAGL